MDGWMRFDGWITCDDIDFYFCTPFSCSFSSLFFSVFYHIYFPCLDRYWFSVVVVVVVQVTQRSTAHRFKL